MSSLNEGNNGNKIAAESKEEQKEDLVIQNEYDGLPEGRPDNKGVGEFMNNIFNGFKNF